MPFEGKHTSIDTSITWPLNISISSFCDNIKKKEKKSQRSNREPF